MTSLIILAFLSFKDKWGPMILQRYHAVVEMQWARIFSGFNYLMSFNLGELSVSEPQFSYL